MNFTWNIIVILIGTLILVKAEEITEAVFDDDTTEQFNTDVEETETEINSDYHSFMENLNENENDAKAVGLTLNFSDTSDDVDKFPKYFNCSFYALSITYNLTFKYRSFAFSENTPIYMWNGSYTEKRIVGKQHAHYSTDDSRAFAVLMKDSHTKDIPFLIITFFGPNGDAFDIKPEKSDIHTNGSVNDYDSEDEIDSMEKHTGLHISIKDEPAKRKKRSTDDITNKLTFKMTKVMHLDHSISTDAKNEQKSSRTRRQTKTKSNQKFPINLWIDLIAIADYSYFKYFEELSAWYQVDGFPEKIQITYLVETFVAHVINGIAMRFTENLKKDKEMKININLMAIVVGTEPDSFKWSNLNYSSINKDKNIMDAVKKGIVDLPDNSNESLSITLALNNFRKFMKNNFLRTPDFPSYDYAIGLTREKTMDLFRDSDGQFFIDDTVGFSYQKLTSKNRKQSSSSTKPIIAMCNDYGYSIIGSTSSLKVILIATHEMIHTLGVFHDGDINDPLASLCDTGEYMLATIVGDSAIENMNKAHLSWYFSKCTIAQLKNNLLDKNQTTGISTHAKCLEDVIRIYEGLPNVNGTLAGQVYSANMQCKLWLGVHATLCLDYVEDVCSRLVCKQHHDTTMCQISGLGAADGTPCGNKKWCKSDCIWGDLLPVCHMLPELHREKPNTFNPYDQCKTDYFKKNCCETCKRYTMQSEVSLELEEVENESTKIQIEESTNFTDSSVEYTTVNNNMDIVTSSQESDEATVSTNN